MDRNLRDQPILVPGVLTGDLTTVLIDGRRGVNLQPFQRGLPSTCAMPSTNAEELNRLKSSQISDI